MIGKVLVQGRPTHMRPNLELKLGNFSIFWVFFQSFCQKNFPKSQYLWSFFLLRPRDRFGLANPVLVNQPIYRIIIYGEKSVDKVSRKTFNSLHSLWSIFHHYFNEESKHAYHNNKIHFLSITFPRSVFYLLRIDVSNVAIYYWWK